MMPEDQIAPFLSQFPNFAGFSLLGILLYRALMRSIENNKSLADKLVDSYKTSMVHSASQHTEK